MKADPSDHLPRVVEAAVAGALAGAIVGLLLVFLVGHRPVMLITNPALPPGPEPLRWWLVAIAAGAGCVVAASDRHALLGPRSSRARRRFAGGIGAVLAGALPAISVDSVMKGDLPWVGWTFPQLVVVASVLGGLGLLVAGAHTVASLVFDEDGHLGRTTRFALFGALVPAPLWLFLGYGGLVATFALALVFGTFAVLSIATSALVGRLAPHLGGAPPA